MNDLKTIRKINSLVEADKQRKLARAMNNPGGHAKSAEKGYKQRITPGACRGLDILVK